MNGLMKLLSRFSRDEKGVVAIIFALALLPLLGAGGAAIDYSRAFIVQSRLANALDATALALGASNISDDQKLKEYGQQFFDANYPADKLGVPSAIVVTPTERYIRVTGSAQLPTSLMGVIGINKLGVSALAEVSRERKTIELAMVLDNSGSMSGSKLVALKQSANLLVDFVYNQGGIHNDLAKVALVPFSSSVNVGPQNQNSGWIDTQKRSPLHGINFNGKPNIFNLLNTMRNTSWGGCVEARSYPMDVRDTPPNPGDGKTLWVPFFLPDEPDRGRDYEHNYLRDGVRGSNAKRQKSTAKYRNASVRTNRPNPNWMCTVPIVPLTNDRSAVEAGISSMFADGVTVIPAGLAWGWRVLSPSAPFTEGADYENKQNPTVKALVLMTDGENFIGRLNNHNKSIYNAYGYTATQRTTNRLGTTNKNRVQGVLDDRTSELCRNIKNAGIVVFTISFDLRSNNIKNRLQRCASDADKYFDAANTSDLKAAFKTIGTELGELRLSR